MAERTPVGQIEPWSHESCFDCQLRMPDDRAADVHYAMTGHQMGWPLDVDEMGWPLASEAQVNALGAGVDDA